MFFQPKPCFGKGIPSTLGLLCFSVPLFLSSLVLVLSIFSDRTSTDPVIKTFVFEDFRAEKGVNELGTVYTFLILHMELEWLDSIDALQKSSPFSAFWPFHSNQECKDYPQIFFAKCDTVNVFLAKRNQRGEETGFPFWAPELPLPWKSLSEAQTERVSNGSCYFGLLLLNERNFSSYYSTAGMKFDLSYFPLWHVFQVPKCLKWAPFRISFGLSSPVIDCHAKGRGLMISRRKNSGSENRQNVDPVPQKFRPLLRGITTPPCINWPPIDFTANECP